MSAMEKIVALCQGAYLQQSFEKIWKVCYSEYAHSLLQQGLLIQKQCLLIWKSARTQILKSYWSWSETASYDAIVPLMYQRASVFN